MTQDPLLDTMAGNYRLVARLGSGGMGEVYKGVHGTIGSKVAIKLLHAMAARDRAMQERFLLEAQAVNRIDHSGVVKVIDAGRTERGRPFLVMELLEGQSLHELRKAGQLTIEEACRSMVDVLDALAAAHAAGVVHRDLKPANLFRTKDGRTVVLDFGVAKLMASDAVRLTMTGSAVGTPHYMAPEQIRGQAVTPLVDVYAAGVVLFELLCNRRPFDNTDEESVMAGHLERRPPPPRALEPAIPTRVSDLILAALQKDPSKRPPSAAAMRDALRKAIGDSAPQRTRSVPPTAPPPDESSSLPTAAESPHARASVRSPRWRRLAVAGAAVFALVGLVLVIYAAQRSKAEHAASATVIAPPATTPPVDALVATCEQLVTVNPVGVPDAEQVAVKATFYQRCAEDRWQVAVIHCFVTVTTAFDLTRCVTALSEEQRRRLQGALAGPWSPLASSEPVGPIPDAFVSITSVPSRAKLTVDDVELGETPWAGRLPIKTITIEIEKKSYDPHRSTFEVRGDSPNVLKIKLTDDRY